MKIAKKCLSLLMCFIMLIMGMALSPEQEVKAASISDFVNDARWCDGINWGSGQRPKLSSYSAVECCAYVCDFVKYVYGHNSYKDGATTFTNINEIREGDVIHTGNHYFAVLGRNGNQLYTAEGNMGGKVCISNSRYTISGSKIAYRSAYGPASYTIAMGYHHSSQFTAHNPTGVVDSCQSNEQGKLSIRGWAFDEDSRSTQIEIHVYVGGEGHNLGPASGNRPDVDNVYHCGAFHGFDKTITTSKVGNQKVDIFAINVGGGNNTLLFSSTVNILAEKEKPKISNIQIYNINEKGYRVSCDVSDNIGVTSVKFPTWRVETGNPVWYEGVKEYDNRWSFIFDKADIINAKYVTHIYAYDAAGNVGSVACDEVTVMNDTEAPQITKLEVKEVSKNKITLHVEATDNNLLGAFTVLSNVMYSNNAIGKLVADYDYGSVNDCIGKCNYSGNIELKGYKLSNVPVYLNVAVTDASGNGSAVKTISTKCMGEEDNYAEINLKQGESIKTSEIKHRFGDDVICSATWLNENEDAILELKDSGTDEESIVAKRPGSEYVYFNNYMQRIIIGVKITVISKDKPAPTPGLTPIPEPGFTPAPNPSYSTDSPMGTTSPTKTPVSSNTSVPKTTTRPSVNRYTSGYTRANQHVVKRPGKVKLKTMKLSSIKARKNAKKITGKVSVSKATVKIKVGKKAYKKATVKGKKFTLKVAKLKGKTRITIQVTKKGYRTIQKTVRVK